MRLFLFLLPLAACKTNPPPEADTDADADADTDTDADTDADTDTDTDADTDADADTDTDTDTDTGTPGVPLQPYAASGSRLSAVHFEDASGYRRFVGFWDTLLSEACTFNKTSPTTVHCVPDLRASLSVFHPDSTCSEPTLSSATDCPLEGIESRFVPALDACENSTLEPWDLTAELGPHTTYFSDATGTCIESDPLPDGWGWSGAPEPLVGFVEATTAQVESNGVWIEIALGDDGSRQTLGLRDATGAPCSARFTADGATRCVPSKNVAFHDTEAPLYSDAACTQPVAAGSGGCVDRSVILEVSFAPGPLYTMREPGPRLPSGNPVYSNGSGSCQETTAFSPFHWEIGLPRDFDDFAFMGPEVERGVGVTQTWHTDLTSQPLVPVVRPPTTYTGPDDDCRLVMLNGGIQCVPLTAGSTLALVAPSTLFADAACSQPVYESAAPQIVVYQPTFDLCISDPWVLPEVFGYYDLGPEHLGDFFTQVSPSGPCGPAPSPVVPLHTVTNASGPTFILDGI